ncbi:MAG: hypothetical protein ABGX07_11860, partial [Pirellulaceae bacterium]
MPIVDTIISARANTVCHSGMGVSVESRSTIINGVAGGKKDMVVATTPFGSRSVGIQTNIRVTMVNQIGINLP